MLPGVIHFPGICSQTVDQKSVARSQRCRQPAILAAQMHDQSSPDTRFEENGRRPIIRPRRAAHEMSAAQYDQQTRSSSAHFFLRME
jgi:hypothetical protein